MNDTARFKVLADPHRQAIVERLSSAPATVAELTRALGISQPAVSHHLKLMREAELVRFQGENHGINSRPSVSRTHDEILLEWFDKHLRGEPQAWAARWDEDAPAAAERASGR